MVPVKLEKQNQTTMQASSCSKFRNGDNQFALSAVFFSWNGYYTEKQTPSASYSPPLPLNDKDWATQMIKSLH